MEAEKLEVQVMETSSRVLGEEHFASCVGWKYFGQCARQQLLKRGHYD